jgi:hypothetical protein
LIRGDDRQGTSVPGIRQGKNPVWERLVVRICAMGQNALVSPTGASGGPLPGGAMPMNYIWLRVSVWILIVTTALGVQTTAGIGVLAGEPSQAARVTLVQPEPSPIAFGVTQPDALRDPNRIDTVTDQLGRMPAIVAWYQAWGNSNRQFDPSLLESVRNRGAMPLITWEPWDPAAGVEQPSYHLGRIARGDFDVYIDSWATGLAVYGGSVYLRFAHEMNGSWYPWAVGTNGNTVDDYVTAWRYVHDRFDAAGAENVRWVWSPLATGPEDGRLTQSYPGDAYVDWVGLDGFNEGTTRPDSIWRDFASIFCPAYTAILALTDRPIMIPEMASAEEGGDKATWVTDAFATQLPSYFPNIRAVVWFNRDKEADWRIDSSPASLAAFREILANPYLQGTLP